jgi:hypothetical protein
VLKSLVILSAACCLAAWFPGQIRAEGPENVDLDLLGGILVSNIHATSGGDEPVSIAGGASAEEKSVLRAMLLSALLPGLGEIYAGGTRGYVTGAAMAATDAFSLWQYVGNSRKGDDWKDRYRDFADTYYDRQRLHDYVLDTLVYYSGIDLGFCNRGSSTRDSVKCEGQIGGAFPIIALDNKGRFMAPDDDFYRQIGADDAYVMGWRDWSTEGIESPEVKWTGWTPGRPLPEGLPATTPLRERYQGMRDRADDYYGRSDLYAWVMVIGRVVSVIDTAILVKMRNSDLAGIGTNPRLTLKVKPLGKVDVKLGLKVRF